MKTSPLDGSVYKVPLFCGHVTPVPTGREDVDVAEGLPVAPPDAAETTEDCALDPAASKSVRFATSSVG